MIRDITTLRIGKFIKNQLAISKKMPNNLTAINPGSSKHFIAKIRKSLVDLTLKIIEVTGHHHNIPITKIEKHTTSNKKKYPLRTKILN